MTFPNCSFQCNLLLLQFLPLSVSATHLTCCLGKTKPTNLPNEQSDTHSNLSLVPFFSHLFTLLWKVPSALLVTHPKSATILYLHYYCSSPSHHCACLMAQQVKTPAVQEILDTLVRSLGQEDPFEKELGTHSSIIAWDVPWTEEPGGPQSMGSQRVRHN